MIYIKGKKVYHVVSYSGGKDSTAMLLRLMKERRPIDYVLFYDTGMEFEAVYRLIRKMQILIERYGAKFIWIKPEEDFLTEMLLRPVKKRGTDEYHYGMEWCGRMCRWRTSGKIATIQKFLDSLDGDYIQYIGIAADEPERIKYENGKIYPLVEWGMSEVDCLQYCWDHNAHWIENGIELYGMKALKGEYKRSELPDGLTRLSCWCCCNKSLSELRFYYVYLPKYWGLLKGMQSRIDRPFRSEGWTIFDLENRFKEEGLIPLKLSKHK